MTPTNLRVIFAGDEKEYEAILGATDSKLGLAYVLIRDLKGRTAGAVDLNKAAEPTWATRSTRSRGWARASTTRRSARRRAWSAR